jgi:hypothetical protein
VFSGGIRVKAVFSSDFTTGLVFFLLLLEGCNPWELSSFHHHSASRIFITQPGRNLRPVVIHKDDYQPLWWREASRAAASPLPSASRMFIIRTGEEGEPSGSFAFRVGWRSASSSSIRGRRAFTGFAEEANSGYTGPAVYGAVSCRVSGSPAWVALVPPPALPPAAGAERGCPSTARATVAPCAGWPHPRLLPRHRSHREVVQGVVRRGGGGGVLGWSCPRSRSEDGSEDLFVRAGAAAAHRCRGGRCHWWG